jgi:hypothetical protein
MKYQIFKKEENGWVFVSEHLSLSDALNSITNLRNLGNEYQLEERNGHIAKVLDV